jgi:hypothetical protein
MEMEKLSGEGFLDSTRGKPSVRFTSTGLVEFNRAAITHLQLCDKKTGYCVVNFCRDPKHPADFGVFKDTEGWQLRRTTHDRCGFNNVGLSQHVIDATWNKGEGHPAGSVKPRSYTFGIALLPLDDNKNKDVFALLRKKE